MHGFAAGSCQRVSRPSQPTGLVKRDT
jgi:hypothetical protein